MVGVNFISVSEHISKRCLTAAAFGKWRKAIIPQREGEKIYMLHEYVDLFRLRLPINPREQTFAQMPPPSLVRIKEEEKEFSAMPAPI